MIDACILQELAEKMEPECSVELGLGGGGGSSTDGGFGVVYNIR